MTRVIQELCLPASDLWSKFGFEDGDIFTNHGLYEFEPSDRADDLLSELIRRYLLPLCPERVVLSRVVTCHNPIRAEAYWTHNNSTPEWAWGICATVTYEQARAVWEAINP